MCMNERLVVVTRVERGYCLLIYSGFIGLELYCCIPSLVSLEWRNLSEADWSTLLGWVRNGYDNTLRSN